MYTLVVEEGGKGREMGQDNNHIHREGKEGPTMLIIKTPPIMASTGDAQVHWAPTWALPLFTSHSPLFIYFFLSNSFIFRYSRLVLYTPWHRHV